MHTLHLTEAEAKKFAAHLSKCTVETETQTFEDSPRRRGMRFELLSVTDPELLKLKDAMQKAKTDAEMLKALQMLDISKIGDAQFTQMLFALGPDGLSHIIDNLLSGAPTTADIEAACAYSMLRHDMLESLLRYSPKEP